MFYATTPFPARTSNRPLVSCRSSCSGRFSGRFVNAEIIYQRRKIAIKDDHPDVHLLLAHRVHLSRPAAHRCDSIRGPDNFLGTTLLGHPKWIPKTIRRRLVRWPGHNLSDVHADLPHDRPVSCAVLRARVRPIPPSFFPIHNFRYRRALPGFLQKAINKTIERTKSSTTSVVMVLT